MLLSNGGIVICLNKSQNRRYNIMNQEQTVNMIRNIQTDKTQQNLWIKSHFYLKWDFIIQIGVDLFQKTQYMYNNPATFSFFKGKWILSRWSTTW